MRKGFIVVVAVMLALSLCASSQAQTIRIGLNIPMTGDIPKVGEGSKYAAQMWLEDIVV